MSGANRRLKNRTTFSNSFDNKLIEKFNQLNKGARIDKSKLLDETVKDLLIKYGYDLDSENEDK